MLFSSGGLDSSTAFQVISLLKSLARSHSTTIVASLHTPSMKIYELFDEIILLARGGQLIFSGSRIGALKFFARLGFKCPNFQCPADYFIEILSDQENCSKLVQAFRRRQSRRIDRVDDFNRAADRPNSRGSLADEFPAVPLPESGRLLKPSTDQPYFHQVRWLAHRNFLQFQHQRANLALRIAQYFILSFFVGLLYYQCGIGQNSIYGRLAFVFFILSMSSLMIIVNSVMAINEERQLFDREHAIHLYRVSAYFLTKAFFHVETPLQFPLTIILGLPGYYLIGLQTEPAKVATFILILFLFTLSNSSLAFILAASTSSPLLSIILTPLVVVPSMVTCGFFINLASLPPWIQWFPYISPFYYAFLALLNNEFQGLKLICERDDEFIPAFAFDQEYKYCPFQDGESVIDLFGLPRHSITLDAMAILALAIFYRILAYFVLRFRVDQQPFSMKLFKRICCGQRRSK